MNSIERNRSRDTIGRKTIGVLFLCTILAIGLIPQAKAQATPGDAGNFITTWQVADGDLEITIPTTDSGYNYDVYWKEVGNTSNNGISNGNAGDETITFPSAGIYQVEIAGDFPRIFINFGGDKDKILTIEQWGDIAWTSMDNAFAGATNLTLHASDAPDLSLVIGMNNMFRGATSFIVEDGATMNNWEVGNVQFFNNLFNGAEEFNGDLSNWNTENAKQMSSMFYNNFVFNSDLSGWDVFDVTIMNAMFYNNYEFQGDLSEWDVDNVQNMEGMFRGTIRFNSDLSGWEVGNVTNMKYTFQDAYVFDADLSGWDVSKVGAFEGMFLNAKQFNSDISGWTTFAATNMKMMFLNASSFNQNVGGWDIEDVTVMDQMFNNSGLSVENYDQTLIGWEAQNNQGNVTLGAEGLEFCSAENERQSLKGAPNNWTILGDMISLECGPFVTTWKTDNTGDSNDDQIQIPMIGDGYDFVVYWGDGSDEPYTANPGDGVEHNLQHTYDNPGTYTVYISGDFPRIYVNNSGDRQKVLTVELWGDIPWASMENAFYGASNLTVPATDAPDLSGVTNMRSMFMEATSFNHYIGHWDMSNATSLRNMFNGATAFNQYIGDWNTSNVEEMNGMFEGSTSFDQDISTKTVNAGELDEYTAWDVSKVEEIGRMFAGATDFNKNIGNWNTGNVEGLNGMFEGATVFNQDISTKTVNEGDPDEYTAWNVSGVNNMSTMFSGATAFNQDIGNWNLSSIQSIFPGDGMVDMLDNSGLSSSNYDAILIGWESFVSSNTWPESIELGAEGLMYCQGSEARESLTTTYSWTIDGDELGCLPPEGEDQRIFVSNAEEYIFSGDDFGIYEDGYSIKIESLPDEGTLKLDGNPVNEGDEISLEEMDNEKFTWEMPDDEYGYLYTFIEFYILDDIGTQSDEYYYLTIDLGTVSVELTGGEGWRFMSNPSEGDSYDDLLAPMWIKGIPGSDSPGSDLPNVLNLDQLNYQWETPADLNNATKPGQPFIVYVYSDDDNDGTPEGFPKTLTSGDNWLPMDGSFSFDGLGFDESAATSNKQIRLTRQTARSGQTGLWLA